MAIFRLTLKNVTQCSGTVEKDLNLLEKTQTFATKITNQLPDEKTYILKAWCHHQDTSQSNLHLGKHCLHADTNAYISPITASSNTATYNWKHHNLVKIGRGHFSGSRSHDLSLT